MSSYDPTAPDSTSETCPEYEWSVEETAQTGIAGISGALTCMSARPPVITLKKRPVSGRYRSTGGAWILDLRVDVDRIRPMNRVSGDFFQVSGATISYFGSFRVDAPAIGVTPATVTITGTGTYTYTTSFPNIRITIPRRTILQPPAPATIQFFSASNAPGAAYLCAFASPYFRTVQFEQDSEQGVTPLVSYNTGSLPSGGSARALSVATSYAEAGVEMQISPGADIVPTAEAGSNLQWSNSELHAAMVKHFSLWQDVPQWKVWLLAAYEHELGPTLYGIMFDQQGKQRQGCATFHKGIGGTTADKLRLQLFTYVHELGHCFNLLHSWQKSFAVPPVPNRPNALSWMNYPWNYPSGGATAFWNAFPFQFDDQEIVHLRHAFRNDIVMGGNNFATGSALSALCDDRAFAEPVVDNSGLKLELEASRSFALGEPVVMEIKLRATENRGKMVHSHLHPNLGFVQIGIRRPSGHIMVYQPLIEHCVASELVKLDVDRPAIHESAYIGYGKDGFHFDQPGIYQIRATYSAPDGSQVTSNILQLRVRSPRNAADEDVADLFFGHDQGTLLYLLGSDSEFLKSGNDAFDLMLDKHGRHPLAVYARLVKGINAGRTFKQISADRTVEVRKPETDKCVKLLSSVVDVTEAGAGVDNITLNMAMRSLAKTQKAAGEESNAKDTMDRMVGIFTKKELKPYVLQLIRKQAEETLQD